MAAQVPLMASPADEEAPRAAGHDGEPRGAAGALPAAAAMLHTLLHQGRGERHDVVDRCQL